MVTVSRKLEAMWVGRVRIFLGSCTQMDEQLYLGMNLEVGYSLDDKYNVTQFLPGDLSFC